MIKPAKLSKGDQVALVSLSSGIIGESQFIHKYDIAKKRLKEEFGLELVPMKNALKGVTYLYQNPQARASDLMDAFANPQIKAIFCAIGGDDSIRLLPYIDYEIIQNNPKIFMGYSDSTIIHFMLYKAGVTSFYGPAIMTDFAEYVDMHPYTKNAVKRMLFEAHDTYLIEPSQTWSKDFVNWDEANINIAKKLLPDEKGYEILQGDGIVSGELLGGCIETFSTLYETELWPKKEKWKNKILFLETSEMLTPPIELKMMLRTLLMQGILANINGIIIGKPYQEKYYEEYKAAVRTVLQVEANLPDLPIFYNVNIGHAIPTGILPYGIKTTLDCQNKTIQIMENFVK